MSTPRVAAWRRLKRLGAVALTPGSAVVAYSEFLHEQMDWIAEEITDEGGDAFVLPVGRLPARDEARIRRSLRRSDTESVPPARLTAGGATSKKG